MKKFLYCLAIFCSVVLLFPAATFAHTPNIFPSGYWGGADPENSNRSGIVSCSPPIQTIRLGGEVVPFEPETACKSLCDLIHTLIHLIVFGMSITLFGAAPILFAWGGILILTSAGNPGKISDGKKILTGTLIGILIILSAYLIVKTFIDALGISGITFGVLDCVVK
ncbi:MAG: hypothetical protein A3B25_01880 [Candidatus Ryanbacteria bacterium RIFCSPLOWO2_01_FULL_48_26]|uniref:Uncharacterized protein n=1 Tax=Candidatus Ryanbacteria bacterium RIFCSPLOWO2_01_FULL_48_26 TaxID=1802126 RepID=A0A1G2GTB0_9BACT|nr:MAG: hypothetical protein A3B25_01880 [Candidatus Ryanbacteria bacterium RIFCSPLOWO2_01_FULL_48_26]